MPSLKDLRTRIDSVKSTKKITQAMKMVAASKLRKAQDSVESARPYAKKMEHIVSNISNSFQDDSPGLLMGNGNKKNHLLIVITADRGLCGAYNSSIVREVRNIIRNLESENKSVKIYCLGKKGADGIANYLDPNNLIKIKDIGKQGSTFHDAEIIAKEIISYYAQGSFDVCTIVYNHFQSVISQIVTSQTIIPYDLKGKEEALSDSGVFEYEPDESELLDMLLPKNIAVQLYQAVLEANASEQGARMTAMDNATRNAGEMIEKLTLSYNRQRQAMITKELIEIVSGAEAL